jgi:DNA-binding CsgD family transcriptional regulator
VPASPSYVQRFPCLQAAEVKRAYDFCESALNGGEANLDALQETPFPELIIYEDAPEWWQLYEIDITNCRAVYVWFVSLLEPVPGDAFRVAAKALYALAGLTAAEAEAVLLHHEGESFRRVARRLEISLGAVQDRITSGELKLARLKEL